MVTGEILKRMGYNVEYRVTGNMAGNVAITQGEMHVDMEYWVSNNRVKFLKQTHGGGAEGSRALRPRTREKLGIIPLTWRRSAPACRIGRP